MENHGIDGLGNTPITAAAACGNWDEVRKLLRQGADVRTCNCFGQNALYFTMADGEYDLSMELFDAGARLDELAVVESGSNSLAAAAELRRTGRDVFDPIDKSVANLCRTGAYEMAEARLDTASPEECSRALDELVRNGKYRPEINLSLAEKLFQRGGQVDFELVGRYASIRPPQLRNPESYTMTMLDLVRKYQHDHQ